MAPNVFDALLIALEALAAVCVPSTAAFATRLVPPVTGMSAKSIGSAKTSKANPLISAKSNFPSSVSIPNVSKRSTP